MASSIRRWFDRADDTRLREVTDHLRHGLLDRLADTKRRFTRALDVGSGPAALDGLFPPGTEPADLVALDFSHPRLAANPTLLRVQADLTAPLPFAPSTFDLIVCSMVLHWVDDVPAALLNVGRLLKPDGLFLASTLGLDSFHELRTAFAESGSPYGHVMPLTDVRSAGMVLQRVGFAMPAVDRDTITLTYSSFDHLYADLKAAGPNLHPQRCPGLLGPRRLRAMEQTYRALFALPDGRLPLTIEVLYLHGWRPHASQQKPLKPGTAQIPLTDVLRTLPPKANT